MDKAKTTLKRYHTDTPLKGGGGVNCLFGNRLRPLCNNILSKFKNGACKL